MTTNNKPSILLCEDDQTLAALTAEHLRGLGYTVDCCDNGQEGLDNLLSHSYDLCLLDIMMPEKTGLEVLTELREVNTKMPVIIVSQRADKEDIIAGYKAGCNDYVTKPFSMDVLVCKVESFLRLMNLVDDNTETTFQLGTLSFNSVNQLLNTKKLSGRESDLLLLLCQKRGQTVERSLILKALWKRDNYFSSRSLSVYINHLRHYLSADPKVHIFAVHGRGYKLVVDE
ncbi:MAG: response regulator transcription factor [Paludibacteraceae bacterium]|nr:response regulator transcription factor [Paludibacteraceae bacterium]